MHKVRTAWPLATRVQYIVAYQECRRRWGLSARRFCAEAAVPYSTFARWWAGWRKQGKRALPDRSRRPGRSPHALPGRVLDVIRRAQRELNLGVRRLHAQLRQAGLIACSLSSVYRVLRRCGALVDDCSRYLAATVLEKRTTAAVCRTLPGLLNSFPFPLRCIQTDNGSEFGRDLTLLLRRLGIRHTRIRPRSPHLNGKVERVQRTVQEEFWDGIASGPVDQWERFLQDYLRFYNRHRLHSALAYATPLQYVLGRLPRRARISHMS